MKVTDRAANDRGAAFYVSLHPIHPKLRPNERAHRQLQFAHEALLRDTTIIRNDDGTPRRHRVSRAEGRAYQVAGLRVIFHRTYAVVIATDYQIAAVADRLLD